MNDECMVCLDPMINKVTLKCNHEMCRGCLEKLNVMICPYCRRNIITNQTVDKLMSNIINKVLENEQDKAKCTQILQKIDELYECLYRTEITVSELTINILTCMMDISDSDTVKRIIKEETCLSVIDMNY
jgi:hypothetical protein